MKKILSIILVFCIISLANISVSAKEISNIGEFNSSKTLAYIRCDGAGKKKLCTEKISEGIINGPYSFEYITNHGVPMYESFKTIVPLSTINTTNSGTGSDDTYSATVYVTLYYNYKNYPYEYLLTRVEGSYTVSDSTVTVTGGRFVCQCIGTNTSTGVHDSSQIKSFNLGRARSFGANTGFTKYMVNSANGIGAGVDINFRQGSRTYTGTFRYYI